MDIQKEEFIKRFKSTFVYDLLSQTLTDEQLFEHVIDPVEGIIWFKDQTRQMWEMWQQAQKVAVPDTHVLMPKDATQEIYRSFQHGFNNANLGNTAQNFKVGYKAMTEALEQVG